MKKHQGKPYWRFYKITSLYSSRMSIMKDKERLMNNPHKRTLKGYGNWVWCVILDWILSQEKKNYYKEQYWNNWWNVNMGCRLDQRSAKCSPQPKSSLPPIFVKTFYWNTAKSIHFWIVYGYFCTTKAGLSARDRDCNRDHRGCRPKIFSLSLYRKKICLPLD